MKNGTDNLKEKAIKANELENASGGEKAWPEKHPLDKSSYEAQSEKGINVNGGERLSLDKLKDNSGGYNFKGYAYWVDESICANKCHNTTNNNWPKSCRVTNKCPAIKITLNEFGPILFSKIKIDPWLCSHCDGCARECPYEAIKPYGR